MNIFEYLFLTFFTLLLLFPIIHINFIIGFDRIIDYYSKKNLLE